MKTGRIEAFSDGVLAIIITIMVLELKVPHGSDLHALRPMVPVFLSYVLSFIYVGIYWNNHHHLFHATEEIGGGVLWANLGLLFCLSLIPVVTAWVGESFSLRPRPSSVPGLQFSSTPARRWPGSSPTPASSDASASAEDTGPRAARHRRPEKPGDLHRPGLAWQGAE